MKSVWTFLIACVVLLLLAVGLSSPVTASPTAMTLTTARAMDGFFWIKIQYSYGAGAPADSTLSAYNAATGFISAGQHWIVGQPARDSFLAPDGGTTNEITGTVSVQTIHSGVFSPLASAPFSYSPPQPPAPPSIVTVQTSKQ